MPTLVRVGGAWQTLSGCQVFSAGSWRNIVAIKVYSGGAWRTVANFTPPGSGGGGGGSLSLSLSATNIHGVFPSSTLTSSTVTVTPSGGTAPYSYKWSIVSSDGHSFTINSSGSANASVTASGVAVGTTAECVIHCVVTDAVGATATSGNVTADLTNSS